MTEPAGEIEHRPIQTSKVYEIVGPPLAVNYFDNTLQRVVAGYEVQAKWLNTGTVVTVRVPGDGDVAAAVDAAIRTQGIKLDAIKAL